MKKTVLFIALLFSMLTFAQTASVNGSIVGKQLFRSINVSKLSPTGGMEFITTKAISPDGKFAMQLSVAAPDIYVLELTDGASLKRHQVLVVAPNEQLNLQFNSSYQNLQLTAATGSKEVEFMQKYQAFALQAEAQSKTFEQRYMAATTDADKKQVQVEFEQFYLQFQQNTQRLLSANATLLSAGFMAYSEFGNAFAANKDLFALVGNGLKSNYPKHWLTQEIDVRLQQAVVVGSVAPEIELKGINGETIKLSDLKGKYVLIDFWASWCGPCRMESPTLVRAYNQYKDKNFAILSVSLDNNKDKWVAAIQADGLNWPWHGSSLMRWNCPVARRYAVSSIPYSLLVDPQGKVMAIGLRGEALLTKLAQVLGK